MRIYTVRTFRFAKSRCFATSAFIFAVHYYNQTALDPYVKESPYNVNEVRARTALFVVCVLGNTLSDFTHIFDIWKAKETEIMRSDYQVPLSDSGFSENDKSIISDLLSMYPISLIDSNDIIIDCSHLI